MVFTARDGSPLLMAAGLWDEWKNRETGERLKSCTMIVTEPDDFAAEIRDRMPVFLMEEHFAPWLGAPNGAIFWRSLMTAMAVPPQSSPAIIGDPTLGDAILDRLVHNAHRLQLTGESMRKQNARNQTLDVVPNA